MKKVLISVSDKQNLEPLAKALVAQDYEILSTGGTKTFLESHGFKVTAVSDYTKFPELLEGRLKTLHPKIHGGILANREKSSHMDALKKEDISPIDMVVVNLYPFEATIKKENITQQEAIEQIDIGGPTLLRSAAKNMASLTALCDPSDYKLVIEELKHHGETTLSTRVSLAQKVFHHTAHYDQMIASYLSQDKSLQKTWSHQETLRYGENPHQEAYLYKDNTDDPYSLFAADILHGKKLSYNNIQDANAALNIIAEFSEPCAVALKHMNPCGIGVDETIEKAYQKAYNSDSTSIFGGIVALNRKVTPDLATTLNETFLEIIIAPSFDEEALSILKQKKNLRLLQLDMQAISNTHQKITTINGGALVQSMDRKTVEASDLQCVTTKNPGDKLLKELLFAWRAVKHVKSNAIVLSKEHQTIGIGAGQMNRVGAAKLALEWAKAQGHTNDIVLASDAFFPFDDIVKLAHQYGVKAIIQPGGSKRDKDSIDACNKLGIVMVFTGTRHFSH